VIASVLFVAACNRQAPKAAADGCTIKGMRLSGRVVDGAKVLTEEQKTALAKELALLEARTQHQLVVATASSLEGLPIEEYGLCQARRWGIGRKGVDDGVLLLVAPRDRKVRIEVGYGLEKPLRDDEAANIVRMMLPSFEQSRYFEGIQAGTRGIAAEIGSTQ
jgi:uncharacterized protein